MRFWLKSSDHPGKATCLETAMSHSVLRPLPRTLGQSLWHRHLHFVEGEGEVGVTQRPGQARIRNHRLTPLSSTLLPSGRTACLTLSPFLPCAAVWDSLGLGRIDF